MDILTLAMAKAYSDRKGGYTKTSAPVVVIPKGSYEFNNGEFNTPTTQFPKEGDSITLTLDGAVYTETAKKGVVDGLEVLHIGNGASFGGDDTGENYSVVFAPSEGFVLVTDMDELGGSHTTTHTVELFFKTQTIVPIDPKYLPGVCLPVVELSTAPANGTALTDAESALMSTAFEGGAPVVIRCTVYFSILEGMPVSGQFVFCPQLIPIGEQSAKAFCGVIYGINVLFVEEGANWICAIEESA